MSPLCHCEDCQPKAWQDEAISGLVEGMVGDKPRLMQNPKCQAPNNQQYQNTKSQCSKPPCLCEAGGVSRKEAYMSAHIITDNFPQVVQKPQGLW